MKKYVFAIILSICSLNSFSSFAAATSCIPYYDSRISFLGSRLKTLTIAAPAASALAAIGLGPLATIPAFVLTEEVIRIQIELVKRTSAKEIIKNAKDIISPDFSQITDLGSDSIKFYVKVFNRYPSLRYENQTKNSLKIIAQIILDADKNLLFCNGSLKKKKVNKIDIKFKYLLATKKEFNNFLYNEIEKRFFPGCEKFARVEAEECFKEPTLNLVDL